MLGWITGKISKSLGNTSHAKGSVSPTATKNGTRARGVVAGGMQKVKQTGIRAVEAVRRTGNVRLKGNESS
eukprot:4246507-Pleurochrysis_carterae.AAC.2